MLRILASLPIVALLGLNFWMPSSPLGLRGPNAEVKAEVPSLVGNVGEALPALDLLTLEGEPLDLADFRGHPLVVTFERSVDW